MHALIIGSTGATGRELVNQLLEDNRFHRVTVFVRRNFFQKHPKLKEIVVDFEHLGEYMEDVEADVSFSCLGTTKADAGSEAAQWRVDHDYQLEFAKLSLKVGVKHFILLSAIGAKHNAIFFYSRMKGTLEDKIKALNFSSIHIIQPSFIIRPESTRKMEIIAGKLLQFINRMGLFPSFRATTTSALATVMVKSLFRSQHGISIASPQVYFEW
ncbi:NAD(P)H-binding protein [Sphingobacterium sp. LRF_L2]|uniref:NAD(P)H-binding protein n=1 Tax=Sphingobacterium sp. LRF_L2 TaxID=3369421 RepID=UPI003F60AD75